MNDDGERLIDAFLTGKLDGATFPHASHVRVCWALSRRHSRDEAYRLLVAGIRDIARRAGRPDAYHETITRAWFELVASAERLDEWAELFDKSLLGRYYSPARLAAGREEWLEPDLHPLRLPPPAAPLPRPAGVLSRVPVAVAVLATHADGVVHATTTSSLASVSDEPALVSVCLRNGSRTLALVRRAGRFALSILAAGQEPLALRFADPLRPAGKAQFADVPHELSEFGPRLSDAAAWLGCTVHVVHACGDHHIVVGAIAQASSLDRRPLVRHDGSYH
jgi:flavin reductase (DIM6/NTAB) family NADH-FMN oxidoreductase RutF